MREPAISFLQLRATRLPEGHIVSRLRRCASSSAAAAGNAAAARSRQPFYFESGCGLFAKRQSRPFPPPFLSPPSGSFSEPLSTHNRSRDRRPEVNGKIIRGLTNGDDAVLMEENFVGADDGVGAWSTRPKGHAALWSRLILHFWALEAEQQLDRCTGHYMPKPVEYLQHAYEQTIQATASPNEWLGTTTACGVILHCPSPSSHPQLYVTNLGDSQVLVIRPRGQQVLYKSKEQWHWFDCPRQLGTNSPDIPRENAVMDKVSVQENDLVLAMTDGVIDNLWEHEVVQNVMDSLRKWEAGEAGEAGQAGQAAESREGGSGGGMDFVAKELVKAARVIAEDPFAESPFMERAVEEGLAMEGGKLDDISVVAAVCRRRAG
ncbi:MAG: hypothetical protein M1832_001726 [Thelocarpon impressellum]|nr:MAG: hypothetical protein M1832_001726 [Thelocarpon impressellum]